MERNFGGENNADFHISDTKVPDTTDLSASKEVHDIADNIPENSITETTNAPSADIEEDLTENTGEKEDGQPSADIAEDIPENTMSDEVKEQAKDISKEIFENTSKSKDEEPSSDIGQNAAENSGKDSMSDLNAASQSQKESTSSKDTSQAVDKQANSQKDTQKNQAELLHDHSKDFEQEPKDGKEIKTDHTDYKTIKKAMEEASKEETDLLNELPVAPEKIDDRESLVRTDVDLLALDEKGECNLDRMQKKLSMLKDGKPIELHHIGQKMDAPLAELTMEEHRGQGNDTIFHDKTQPTEIDRKAFAAERKHYWATRAQEEIRKEIEKVKSGV